MTNLSNFKTTLDFEKHVLDKVLGREFTIKGTGDQERGQLLEKLCLGKVIGNNKCDLQINNGWDYELKCYYGNKVHISKFKSKKNLKKKVFEKMRRLYLFKRNNQLCTVTFLQLYKLKELNKKKFFEKIKIRYSKSKKEYEVYFNTISDIEYCYNNIKEVI